HVLRRRRPSRRPVTSIAQTTFVSSRPARPPMNAAAGRMRAHTLRISGSDIMRSAADVNTCNAETLASRRQCFARTLLNFQKSVCRQLVDERDQIRTQRVVRRVELFSHRFPHSLQRSMHLAELPDARADRIETEVEAARQIQDDRLALQLAKDDVVGNAN